MFVVEAIAIHHYQDNDNYPARRYESRHFHGEDPGALYADLARFRIDNVRGVPTQWGDYVTVEFGHIQEVVSSVEVDMARLEATPEWSGHLAGLAEADRLERARLDAEASRAAREMEARDRATYEALKDRFA